MLDGLQKLVPWATGLPLIPKLAITAIVLLVSSVFLYLTWVPTPRADPSGDPSIQKAYERMSNVLARIQAGADDQVLVDGQTIDPKLTGYYSAYVRIADFVRAKPNDLEGAYEKIWENGGPARVHTSDTQVFEAVVSAFFHAWESAPGSSVRLSASVASPKAASNSSSTKPADQSDQRVEEPHRVWVQSHERVRSVPTEEAGLRSQSESFYRLGLLRQSEGHHKQAIELFDKAIELDAGFSKPMLAKAISLEQLDRWDDAFRTYGLADDMAPSRPAYASVILNMAATLWATGRLRETAMTFERVLRIHGELGIVQPRVHLQAAEVYRALGNGREEARHIAAFLEQTRQESESPDDDQTSALRRRLKQLGADHSMGRK